MIRLGNRCAGLHLLLSTSAKIENDVEYFTRCKVNVIKNRVKFIRIARYIIHDNIRTK